MSELEIAVAPSGPELRQSIAAAIARLIPGWRCLAQNLLGDDERIDWLGVDGSGRVSIVLLAEKDDDLTLIARGLAQREWARARVADWAQLATGSGLHPEAAVHLVLLAPRFRPSAIAVAAASASGDLTLGCYRFVHNGSGTAPLLERIALPGTAVAEIRESAPPAPFRTGLREDDLDLTPEERAEFATPGDRTGD